MTIRNKMAVTMAMALVTLCFCTVSFAADNNELPRNSIGISGGMLFNVKANFSGTPSLTLRPPDLSDPNSYRAYDDGHVVWDGTMRGARATGDWSYDNDSQKAAHTVDMHQTAWSGTPDSSDDVMGPSAELLYRRAIGMICEKYIWGLEAGIGLASFNPETSSYSTGTASQLTDSYEAFCWWVPSWLDLKAPFKGIPGQDPLIMIDLLPPTRTAQQVTVSTLAKDSLDAILIPIRIGPYINFPICKRLDISVSGGFAAAEALTDYRWSITQTSGNSSRSLSGSHSQSDLLLGGYGAVQASYNLGKNWSVGAGVQYTGLGSLENQADGKSSRLGLNMFGINVGANIAF